MPDKENKEKNVSQVMNGLVEQRLDDYILIGGIDRKKLDEAKENFLRRCAVRNVDANRAVHMLEAEREELFKLLETIYCNTIRTVTVEPDDGPPQKAILTEWSDAATEIAIRFKNYQGTPFVLRTIAEIAAAQQPYEDYRDFFESIRENGEKLNLEELLCRKNEYAAANTIDGIRESAGMQLEELRALKKLLPDGFVNYDLENEKNTLQQEISGLINDRDGLRQEIKELSRTLKSKENELEAKRLEEEQHEKERKMEELNRKMEEMSREKEEMSREKEEMSREKEEMSRENEMLRSRINGGGENADQTVTAYKKKRKHFLTKEQRMQRLIQLMIQKHYSPERIRIICDARDAGADVKDLIKLVESDLDMGTLRETVKFLSKSEEKAKEVRTYE